MGIWQPAYPGMAEGRAGGEMSEHIIQSDAVLKRLEPYCILRGFRGSIAHETYEENTTHDDKDLMGIFVLPEDALFGLDCIETVERMITEKLSEKRESVWDIVYYSLPKYISLLMKQNPNVISLLWIEERFYQKKTKWGQMMVDNRDHFLAKQSYHSFCGYAYGQLHRMTHHHATGQMGAKRKELVDRFWEAIRALIQSSSQPRTVTREWIKNRAMSIYLVPMWQTEENIIHLLADLDIRVEEKS